MNFEEKAQSLTSSVDSALVRLEQLSSQMRHAKKKTEELLAIASEVGVTAVSIGKRHKSVGNGDWGFGVTSSIFTHPDARHDGWPAAWHIASKAGVSSGCGNGGQHQADTSNLIDGVYECRGGVWARIDLEDES